MVDDDGKSVDIYDDSASAQGENSLTPSNSKKIPARKTAVALSQGGDKNRVPEVTASGRGLVAEKILQLAFENDVKVREDGALVEMLAQIDIDSPIPSEAFRAVAEILTYVYRANGESNPFDALLKDDTEDVS